MYFRHKKYIHKKIREELDKMYKIKEDRKNVSQYVEYWLMTQTINMSFEFYTKCEKRNKSQREKLKEKYSIIDKDKLLEKISCLENMINNYKYPKEKKEELEKVNKILGSNYTYEDLLNEKCE